MINKNILQNYQAEVLALFKNHYKKLIGKNVDINFNQVLDITLKELEISHFSPLEINFLEVWFKNVHHHQFVHQIIKAGPFHEIIFHSNLIAQKIFSNQKESFEIDHLSLEDYQLSFEIFAIKNNIAWNYTNPFASFFTQLDQSEFRITLIHYSTSANKISKLFLRSIPHSKPQLNLFLIKDEIAIFLKKIIHHKKNILISGSTNSGKTTLLRALLSEVAESEHVIVLEDTHEILSHSPQQTSLLSDQELKNKSLIDYCAYALRMNPDRLIIGEMRSSEVVPFILAMNTGHQGLMSTIHANSSVDALSRVALLFSLYSKNEKIDFNLITKLICKNIHYVIHMENKNIKEISKVIGAEGEMPIYEIIYQNKNLIIPDGPVLPEELD